MKIPPAFSLSEPQIPVITQIYYDESPHHGALYQFLCRGINRFYHGHHFIIGICGSDRFFSLSRVFRKKKGIASSHYPLSCPIPLFTLCCHWMGIPSGTCIPHGESRKITLYTEVSMHKRIPIEERIVAVLMCVMVVMVMVHVLARYVFHTSFSHTEEIVRYLFVWATFLGASAATLRDRHLSIAGAFRFLPRGAMRMIGALRWAGASLFALLLAVYGVRIVMLQVRTGQTTAALGFPMWMVGLAIPVCSALLLWRLGIIAYRGVEATAADTGIDTPAQPGVPEGSSEKDTGGDR